MSDTSNAQPWLVPGSIVLYHCLTQPEKMKSTQSIYFCFACIPAPTSITPFVRLLLPIPSLTLLLKRIQQIPPNIFCRQPHRRKLACLPPHQVFHRPIWPPLLEKDLSLLGMLIFSWRSAGCWTFQKVFWSR